MQALPIPLPASGTDLSSTLLDHTRINAILRQLFASVGEPWPQDSMDVSSVMQNMADLGIQKQFSDLASKHEKLDQVYSEINHLKAHNRKHDPVTDHVNCARLSLQKLLQIIQSPTDDADIIERINYAENSASAALHRAKQKLSQVRSRQRRKKRMRENDETPPTKKRVVCFTQDSKVLPQTALSLPQPMPVRTNCSAMPHSSQDGTPSIPNFHGNGKAFVCHPSTPPQHVDQQLTQELCQYPQVQAAPPMLPGPIVQTIPPHHSPHNLHVTHVPNTPIHVNLASHSHHSAPRIPSFANTVHPNRNVVVKIPSGLITQQQQLMNHQPTNINLTTCSVGGCSSLCNQVGNIAPTHCSMGPSQGMPVSFHSPASHVTSIPAQQMSIPTQQIPSVVPVQHVFRGPQPFHQQTVPPTYTISISGVGVHP